ncbi:Alpha/Beta hydrolase protein [Amylocystis lapponica]|nr:Alpha/Beta hydrolase protein [Amylocystis lapponica]
MPAAPVDSNGTVLYYEETGAPKGSGNYVTLFLVHGTMLHGAIFRPMFQYAASFNLRLVALNSRDYPGSTPYSPQELRDLKGSPEVQRGEIQKRGLELAAFIHWFIDTEEIPPVSLTSTPGVLTGGFSVLGWSAGNFHTLSMVGNANAIPEDTRSLFENYFRTLVIFDPALNPLGLQPPAELYSPFRDQKLTLDERTSAFPKWVSTYFPQVEGSPGSPAFHAAVISSRTPPYDTSDDTDFRRIPTLERMTPEQLASVTDVGVMRRSQYTLQATDENVRRSNLWRAIFACEGEVEGDTKQVVWPALRVQLVWCDRSHGDCVMTMQELVRASALHKHGRNLEVYRMEGSNHFAHWDEPERFTGLLAEIIGNAPSAS